MTVTASQRTLAGRYELSSLLAPARSTSMYRAHDRRLGRDVAVRVTDVSAMDDDDIDRLTRGAQAAAQVSHPNVAHVQDFGRDGDTAFVVTELLPGPSLADELQAGPLSAERAAQLNSDVGQALAAAHERGVVHGNLTADKLLIASDGRYVVAGFGQDANAVAHAETAADDLAALEVLVTRARGGAAAMATDSTVTLPVADATSVLPIAGATAAAAATTTTPFAGWRIRRTTAAIIAVVAIVLGLALMASAHSGSLTPPTTLPPPTTVTVAPVTTAATAPPTTAPAPPKPAGHGKHHDDG